jgi:hypothetical protein
MFRRAAKLEKFCFSRFAGYAEMGDLHIDRVLRFEHCCADIAKLITESSKLPLFQSVKLVLKILVVFDESIIRNRKTRLVPVNRAPSFAI